MSFGWIPYLKSGVSFVGTYGPPLGVICWWVHRRQLTPIKIRLNQYEQTRTHKITNFFFWSQAYVWRYDIGARGDEIGWMDWPITYVSHRHMEFDYVMDQIPPSDEEKQIE